MSPEQLMKSAVANVEEHVDQSGKRSLGKSITPFSCNYATWLEKMKELKADGIQCYQELIGVLR
jgi:hypothetical protein